MGKYFHRFVIIVLFLFVGAGIFGLGEVYATGGGSFNVPEINDDFNKGNQGPAPQQEKPVNPPPQEEKGFWDSVGDAVTGAWDWTTDTISSAWDSTTEAVTGAWNATTDAISSAWDWTTEAVTDAWNATTDAISSAWDWTTEAVTGAWNWTVDALTSAWDWTTQTLSQAWDWFRSTRIGEIIVGNIEFVVGLGLLAAGAAFTLWKRPGFINSFGNKMLNWGKNLIGVDNSRPHGELKDVEVNDKTLAMASQIVYFDNLSDDQVTAWLGGKWIVEKDPKMMRDLPNGLQARVFRNPETMEIIIAFRGTEGKFNDIAIADGSIALGLDSSNPQAQSARDFVKEVLNNPDYKGYQFVLTGHSLGGYLAVDSGAKYNIPTVTFNAAGKNLFPNVNASTILGGPVSTGSNYIINMLDPHNRKQAINEGLGNYDGLIRNYNFDHDLVGGVGYRPGETYHIDEHGKTQEDEGLDNDLLNMNIDAGSTHSIKNFTGKTDDGKPFDSPLPEAYDENGNFVPR
ncbi:DUF2974 domain-containing protein [Paenactinomyces guangxiensis]|uniref:DUF2974 domain-containing protein n=1 Tax=Paenactinomyces guangxiensis TaxID=1490290 RepID=A0A7W1WV34_9BACL|nr:DUF2974 domain-containing protein [Paenactinomyces guangxiensis]MBA4496552.1 DUF2974 domain-containing protein [Paenactinomyces guangxiensis]MBH8593620.1 DUF2974 domain-containing protein [Paenactinomyces guangxiensis]